MTEWFAQHRVDWIMEIAQIFGFINRKHIQKKFGVSVQQASNDLTAAQKLHPGRLVYVKTEKRYRYMEPK